MVTQFVSSTQHAASPMAACWLDLDGSAWGWGVMCDMTTGDKLCAAVACGRGPSVAPNYNICSFCVYYPVGKWCPIGVLPRMSLKFARMSKSMVTIVTMVTIVGHRPMSTRC